jgi:lysophospholipase L1-like esterase
VRGLSVIVGLLLAVLLCELWFRVHLYGWAAFSPSRLNSLAAVGEQAVVRSARVPGLRYEFKEHLDLELMMVRFVTNAHGLRDDPCPLAKPLGVRRVALVGDSYAMGYGIEHRDTFATQLEGRLAATLGGPVQCLNFGVTGYSLLDYDAVIGAKAWAFEPDLVLVGLCMNDYEAQLLQRFELRTTTRTPGFWRSHLLDDLRARVQRGPSPGGSAEVRAPAPWDGTRSSAAPQPYVHYWLSSIRDRCAAAGVPVLFVYLNFESSRLARTARQVFAEYAAALRLDYLDLTPAFAGREESSFYLFPNDRHPNVAAQQILAQALFEPLRTRLAAPPRSPTASTR